MSQLGRLQGQALEGRDAKVAAAMDTMMDPQWGDHQLLRRSRDLQKTIMFFTDNGAAKRLMVYTTPVESCRASGP